MTSFNNGETIPLFMTEDEEKYQRLIRYNKVMISPVAIICVIITAYVFIEMQTIIIPLVLALIINFMLHPIFSFCEKKNIPDVISILIMVLAVPIAELI
jgi:predicted PurR-regulated permease PerM